MSDDTLPDLRARYSKPSDPWSTFVQHVDGPEDGKATACSRSKAGAPDYQIPRRVLRIEGLSLPHRLAVGLLWDCGDRGAVDTGEPIQVWLSSDSLAKRLDISRRSVVRALKVAGDLGYVIRLRDLVAGHDVWIVRNTVGRWTRERPTCVCVPGSKDPHHCCCRVLAPIDQEGRITMAFDQSDRSERATRASAKVRKSLAHTTEHLESDAGVPIPRVDDRDVDVPLMPIHRDADVPQPALSGHQTLDRSANTADTDEPWHITHRIEHDPWFDE